MAKKFARIIGMSSLFEVGQDNKYDITHIKDSVTDVDNYTICFITTTDQLVADNVAETVVDLVVATTSSTYFFVVG